jgi:lipopolysaccharide export system permease protein
MRTLSIYILRSFLLAFIFCLVFFISFYIIIDVFNRLGNYIEIKMPFKIIVEYYLNKIPFICVQISPVAILLGSLFSLGNIIKHNEIIAIKAGGVNPLRLTIPLVLFGLFVSIMIFFINECLVPPAQKKVNSIKRVWIKKMKNKTVWKNVFYSGKGYWFSVKQFDSSLQKMQGVFLCKFQDNINDVYMRLNAKKAVWDKEHKAWRFYDGIIRGKSKKSSQWRYVNFLEANKEGVLVKENNKKVWKGNLKIYVSTTPDSFKKDIKKSDEMSFWELKKYIEGLKRRGVVSRQAMVDLHSKISFPLASLIMVIISIPCALRSKRGTVIGFVEGLGISFIYYTIMMISAALGRDVIMPVIAAWMGNISFGIVGLIMLVKTPR